ncbi:MAG: cell division protein FtsZ, partial [Acetobacteraceae bacterium]|nr:cell division protein FtsZ [Acetobacteraceae bacterium]
NLDFADIRSVMAEMGKAMMGTGEAEGEDRATRAAESAISNPLLEEASMKGAKAVLINITGGMDMTLFEVDEAANRIRKEVGEEEANIIFGSSISEEMDGRIRVSVVATGMEANLAAKPRPTLVAVGGAPAPRPAMQAPSPAPVAAAGPMLGAGAVPARAAAQPTMSAPAQPAYQTAGATALAPQMMPEAAPEPAPAIEPVSEVAQPASEVSAAPLFAPLAEEAPKPAPAPAPAPAAEPRKSLFTRVTQQLMHREPAPQLRQAPTIGTGEAQAPRTAPAASVEPAARPAPRQMPAEDLGLDIPAFLRRQAN